MDSTALVRSLQELVPGVRVEPAPSVDLHTTCYVEPDDLPAVMRALRDAPALSCAVLVELTAVDFWPRDPRFELIYLLISLEHRFRLRVKVRLPADRAHVETMSGVWPAANWLEREVWDLFGIVFDGHPDPRRLLMPEDWEGFPLRKDYPVQIRMTPRTSEATEMTADEFRANLEKIDCPVPDIRTETMTVNMGPQHPSTHGVLRLVLTLDGETILAAAPTIGYLHTGIEKTAEQKKWQQVVPLVERMDYLSAQSNSLAFCMSAEQILGVQVPERVRWIRVLLAELQRINSHLVWLGTHGMEVGAVSVMLYCFRERELLLNINEMIAGFRMFPSYIRIGGLREDLPRGFHDAVRLFLDGFPRKLDEYEDLLTKNQIYMKRTRDVGRLSKDDAVALGLLGPIARASGVSYDVRKVFPYLGYETFDFEVPTRTEGDAYARYLVRVAEMRESVKICWQALERIAPAGAYAIDDPRITPPPKHKVYTEMEALIQHFLIYSQGITVPAGEAYVPVEGPRGEQGFSIVSDGTNRPWRVKSRAPSLMACQALEQLVIGGLIADVIAVIGSVDVVMGDVDR